MKTYKKHWMQPVSKHGYFTAKDIREIWGISRQLITQWRQTGKIRSIKDGINYYYDKKMFVKYLRYRENKGLYPPYLPIETGWILNKNEPIPGEEELDGIAR